MKKWTCGLKGGDDGGETKGAIVSSAVKSPFAKMRFKLVSKSPNSSARSMTWLSTPYFGVENALWSKEHKNSRDMGDEDD